MPPKPATSRFKRKTTPKNKPNSTKIRDFVFCARVYPSGIIQFLKGGVPYAAVLRFQKASRLSLESISQATQISLRTLARRKIEGRLNSLESERLFRLARLFEKAVNYHEGDVDAARSWMESPKLALGNESPLEMAESEIGAREVEDLLDRLEFGVYS
jgi:putative toxin-antitoxin system antitoxin component (TIGR02293 family)